MARQNKNPMKMVKKYPKTSLGVAVAGGAAVIILAMSGNDKPASNSGQKPPKALTPAEVTRQRQHGGTSASAAQGGAVDRKGSGSTSTDSSSWTKAPGGMITLYSPASGASFKSGDTVSGSAKVSAVQYRLVDKQAGVLAQGQLSVVNGKFAGAIYFKPQSTQGSLDIFSYNQNGAEINSLTVEVKLQS